MQRLKYCIALNRPIIKEEEITTLFGNVEDFQTLHTRMYKDLETAYFEVCLLLFRSINLEFIIGKVARNITLLYSRFCLL